MKPYPIPENNVERLHTLRSYNILDSVAEKEFDDLTALASAICEAPVALISLVDENRQWFKSHHGIDTSETPIDQSFCAHAIVNPNEPLLVPDARNDERFKNNPLVTGDPHIVFYLGVPLVNEAGHALGTLCVIDNKRKDLNSQQLESLKIIAKQVMDKIELKLKIFQLERANERISTLNEKLEESEQTAIHLIDDAPVGIAYLHSRKLILQTANQHLLKILGKNDSILGKPLATVLPELEEQNFIGILDEVYANGLSFSGFETKVQLFKQESLQDYYFNFVFHPVKNNAGTITGIMVIVTEVTDQVLAKQSAQTNEQRLSQMVIANPMGMTILRSRDFIVEVANEPMLKIWGRTEREMIGNSIMKVFPELKDQPFPGMLHKIFDTGETVALSGMPVTIMQKNNAAKNIWVDFTYTPLKDFNGEVEAIMATVIDVTERVRDEQRKNDFIGVVSHEMKTPLTSIKGYLQIIQRHAIKKTDSLIDTISQKALTQIDKMNGLIMGFLDIARADNGKIKLNLTHFKIEDLLQQVMDEMHYQTMSHNISLDSHTSAMVFADRDKIGQVVSNFINNAIKYAPYHKNVVLSLAHDDTELTVSVKDDGLGIDETYHDKIFERFYRVQNEENRGITGFGIGLYICSEIIRKHKGRIGVKSKLGQGSTFWFTLPLTQVNLQQ